jgi:hypothetical protein
MLQVASCGLEFKKQNLTSCELRSRDEGCDSSQKEENLPPRSIVVVALYSRIVRPGVDSQLVSS